MASSRGSGSGGGSPGTTPAHPPRALGGPVFSQPQPTPDPGTFRIRHGSDADAYAAIDKLNAEHKLAAMPFGEPRGKAAEPVLTLTQALGNDSTVPLAIGKQKQIVFHATGDCGNVKGPKTQNEVADKMVADFDETDPREVPQFLLLLGDVIYNFGESQYYYDQFYEPYRNYHAPIFAAAGNHDGMISPLMHAKSLDAVSAKLLRRSCPGFVVTPEAGGLSRTAQIQPGVYFTLDAPLVRIFVVYSNTLEDPGVIANATIGNAQLDYLEGALATSEVGKLSGRDSVRSPPSCLRFRRTALLQHRRCANRWMRSARSGTWPHAVLAGHAHSYQRFTRLRDDGTEIPYIICGNGGHNVLAPHPSERDRATHAANFPAEDSERRCRDV